MRHTAKMRVAGYERQYRQSLDQAKAKATEIANTATTAVSRGALLGGLALLLGATGVGAATGVAAGAVAGSSIGGGAKANLAGAIGGAVVGGLIGATIENNATQQSGLEYIVETSNGSLIALVQGLNPAFAEGDRVLVMYGAPSRVIADPSAR